MKVLIAIDGSDCSEAAIESVLDRRWPEDAEFKVITIIEPIYAYYAVSRPYVEGVLEAQKEFSQQCQRLVDTKVMQFRKVFKGNVVSGKVTEGLIADSIIDEAKDWHADLIVVGSHGRKGFEKFLLGSVAEKVVSHAPCSVEIVKQKVSPKKKQGGQKATVA